MIPWPEMNLGDVIELHRGFDLPTSQRSHGPIPVISSSGVSGTHDKARAVGPGVVVGRYGTLGVVTFAPGDYWPLNTTLFVSDFKGNDPLWVSYLLRTIDYLAYSDKAAVPGVNRNHLHQARVWRPPLPEQRVIAKVLGDLDDKIDLNRRMNNTLEALARALFKSWFVDFDPVRTKIEGRPPAGMDADTAALFPEELVASIAAEIPAGWTCSPLSAWCDALSGGTPSKANAALWGGDVPWISPKVMMDIHADEAEDHVATAAIGAGTRLAPKGTTLVMVRGMGLHERVRISQARRDVTFNQDVKALVPRGIAPSLLLFALLDGQPELLKRVESSGHGTGVMPTDVLMAHQISMPPPHVQAKLVRFFDDINDRIEVAREETRTLASLRDALLPKLLSGELHMGDA